MYKLTDIYWPKLVRVSAIVIILGILLFGAMNLIFELEQYLLNTEIDAYLASNGVEPSREIQNELLISAKLKTFPLSLGVVILVNYFFVKFVLKPNSK